MKPQCAAVSRPKHFPCSVVTLLFATVALLITAGPARAEPVFTPDADYRILTIYGVNTSIELADYQAEGVTATFVLKSCDTSRADYYSTANVTDGKLKLTSNTLGHVHGSNTNTESETVCTVTGTAGSDTEDGVFSLYTVSDRAPHQLDALSLSEARPDAVDIQITGVPDSSYVRLGWRKSGGTPTFRLVSGVSSGTVLTIPNLDVNTEYEIRAYLMTRQSFDLYRSGNTGMPGTLISEGAPARKWIGNLTSSGLGKSQTINVMTAALPTLRINDVTVAEASGAAAAFTVTLNAVSAQVVTVAYATSAGTASAGLDYTSISSTLTIPAGRLTGTIRVPILDDTLDEPDETFTVTLSSPTNATISDDSGTGTITDNDDPPTLRINDVTVAETSGTVAVFTVTLNAVSAQVVTVHYTTVDGTAVEDSDYTKTGGMLSIPVGEGAGSSRCRYLMTRWTSRTDVHGDAERTGQREGGGRRRRGDDHGRRPSAWPEAWTDVAYRGRSSRGGGIWDCGRVHGTLSAVSAQVVTVHYTTVDGTAVEDTDYTKTSGILSIPVGEVSGIIQVPILDDTLDEPDETFTVTLSSPTNATISDDSGTGTITDEDNLEVTVSYEVGSYTVTEGEFIDVTVVLSEPPGRPIVVSVTVMPDSGTVETDYSGVPESVTFGPSETQKTFIFRAVEDAEYDDGEKVVLGFGILPSGVTASDPETSIVTIEDNDFAADVEPKQWLVRFGRTAVVHVTDALDERMRCPPDRRPVEISPNRLPGEISPERRPRWRCRPLHREPQSMAIGGHRLASGVNQTEAFERYAAGHRRDEWMLYGGTLGDWDADAFRSLTVNEFLARSSFHVSSEEEEGWRLSFWGRGAFSRFDGFDGGHTLDGDVTTSTFGVDNAGDRWLSGVALSRSEGEGTFSQDDFEGEFASSLTGLYPYLRYGVSERLSIWGMMGYGAGTLTFTADDVASIETDIDMTMGAVGLRGELLSPADEKDFALTFKADALFMRTASDVVPGLKAAEAEVNRLRLGIEGSWEFVSEDGQWLSPRIEAGLRHDGGDAETGLGVEIGAGLRYAHPEQYLTMELNARSLLTHDAVGLAEWGVSGSLRYDPRPPSELGPSFTLSPSWGAWTSGGVDALWKRADIAALAANDEAAPAGRIDAELAYGFATLDGLAIGTPLTGVSLSESMRAFRLGYRISLVHREDLDFNLSFEGTRRENTRGDEPPEYGCLLRFSIRW